MGSAGRFPRSNSADRLLVRAARSIADCQVARLVVPGLAAGVHRSPEAWVAGGEGALELDDRPAHLYRRCWLDGDVAVDRPGGAVAGVDPAELLAGGSRRLFHVTLGGAVRAGHEGIVARGGREPSVYNRAWPRIQLSGAARGPRSAPGLSSGRGRVLSWYARLPNRRMGLSQMYASSSSACLGIPCGGFWSWCGRPSCATLRHSPPPKPGQFRAVPERSNRSVMGDRNCGGGAARCDTR
jgi:hypothetical protein